MANRDAVEHGPVHRQLGKWIGRVLEGVGRQRRQRLDLADHPEPFDHRRPVAGVPPLDGHRQLRFQKEHEGDRREHHVVRRIDPRDQASQLRHAARRHHAVGDEQLPQVRETRRGEVLTLDALEQRHEQRQIVLGRLDAVERSMDLPAPDQCEQRAQGNPGHQPACTCPLAVHGNGQENRHRRHAGERQPEPRRKSHRRGGGPSTQRAGSNRRFPNRGVIGEHRDVFAKLEHRPQFVDRRLAREHLGNRRALAQPLDQRRLAGTGPRRVDQLEQRRAPEHVEVVCVGMALEVRRAVTSLAVPAAEQAVLAAEIHALCVSRTIDSQQGFRVHDDERAERQPDEQGPQRRHGAVHERHPQQHGAGAPQHQTTV
jgi:hypothetical protein